MKNERKQLIQDHFDLKYQDYDQLIRKLVPKYEEMRQLVVDSLNIEKSQPRILDLGIGTGQIAEKIFMKHPDAGIVGVDLSENMIKMAQARLSDRLGQTFFCHEDMEDYQPRGEFDGCVAVLAIHHIEGERKKNLFEKIHRTLSPGAAFVIGDIVNFNSEDETKKNENKWKKFMAISFSDNEVEYWFNNYLEEDRPSSTHDQVAWLNEVGFSKVKVVWQHINYVVLKAEK